MSNEIVHTFRHVRLKQFDDTHARIEESPCGGISFLFHIDQELGMLTYHYTICPDTQNFSFEIARDVLNGRADKYPAENIFIPRPDGTIYYDRAISLVDNVIESIKANKNTNRRPIGFKQYDELNMMCSKLKAIKNANRALESRVRHITFMLVSQHNAE